MSDEKKADDFKSVDLEVPQQGKMTSFDQENKKNMFISFGFVCCFFSFLSFIIYRKMTWVPIV